VKFSVNSLCPCGSEKKYKKCCKIFHDGQNPKNALLLMKSRYSAYAVGNSRYIINTTHINNKEYTTDKITWEESIKQFMNDTDFKSLEIIDFTDGFIEAYVTFKASIDINKNDSSFTEKSKFVKQNDKWFYLSGEFSQ